MQVLTTRQSLGEHINELKNRQLTLGFVPTMGALHQGHISLIESSKLSCDLSLCSIFVNPRQFNDPNDLARYPRSPEKDLEMLKHSGCDLVFMPEASEVYTEPVKENYDFGLLDSVLEGSRRPGHFNGVAQVLSRLFKAVMPDKAFFGQKDYQQVLVVKKLVKQLNLPLEVISCPIIRENDGLAMSSRNSLLSVSERKLAANIPRWMEIVQELAGTQSAENIKLRIEGEMSLVPGIIPEYFEICDPEDLSILQGSLKGRPAIALIAVFVGKIRLIDNCLL